LSPFSLLKSYQKITHSLVSWINRFRPTSRGSFNALAPRGVQEEFKQALQYAGTKPFVLDPLAEASLRYADAYILSTKSEMHFLAAKKEDIGIFLLKKDYSVNNIDPPVHFEWHKRIYRSSIARAILLCHPQQTILLWKQGIPLDFSVFPSIEHKICDFSIYQEAEFDEQVREHGLIFVPDVGLFSYADDLIQAVQQVELLEWICSVNLGLG
jgi:ribulose-5-phosphate 4-epimerase/fuculose-1-phosphate aldolase